MTAEKAIISGVHGLLPRKNPILGNFQHAPSSRNARQKYFEQAVISAAEYARLKALRQNPYTGQFHTGPRQFSELHGLGRFREAESDGVAAGRFYDEGVYSPQDSASSEGSDGGHRCRESVGSVSLCAAVDVDGASSEEVAEFGRNSEQTQAKPHAPQLTQAKPDSPQTQSKPSLQLDLSEDVSEFGRGHCRPCSISVAAEESTAPKTCPSPRSRWKMSAISADGGGGGPNWMSSRTVRPDEDEERGPHRKRCASSGESSAFTTQHRRTLSSFSAESDAAQAHQPLSDRLLPSSPHVTHRFSVSSANAVPDSPRKVAVRKEHTLKRSNTMDNGGSRQSNISWYDEDSYNLQESNSPWVVKRDVEITTKYKIDMSRAGCLGKGAYSLAKVCEDRGTGQLYCVKIVKKRLLVSSEEKEMVQREVQIHQKLSSPYIVRLHEVFEDSKRLFLVLEKMENGNLEELLLRSGRLREAQAQHIFKQVLFALDYLEQQGILQGDLKPANLLLNLSVSQGNSSLTLYDVKICDFGLSRKVPDIKYYRVTGDVHKVPFTATCGTMGYVAPEILRMEPYTIAVDMWAAGIILYEMLGGIRPFVPYQDCLVVPLQFPAAIFSTVSASACDLTSRMLTVDVALRATPKQALKHPFIEDNIANVVT